MQLNKSSFNPLLPPFRDIGLGWQPIGYKPTAVDYAAYEVICGEFFRQPRARTALMHGGIVWHLAVEHICLESVLIGPTDEVFRIGEVIRPDGEHEYWDDTLSEEELNLICGVYHCETGDKDLLWPKPSSWSHSGLNVGYWSPAAEVWYQNRLAHIQDNTAELYHAKKWKVAVAMHRKTFKVADFNSNFSASFLAGVQFP
ncbi:hypothetical protein K439DRAFT_1366690 [Ramaria rubella]|nr:hypothetical protein K439DRAFT_1366690 [Ramaria rubella]